MGFLNGLRLVILGAVILMSLVVLGASAFLNSKTAPMFHYSMFRFPFAMSIITLVVIPTITIFERKARNNSNASYSRLSTVAVEFPLFIFFLVLWFVCAHTGTSELFGPFRHCNLGAGVGVVAAGLDVPSHCKVVAVVHGPSWLTCFAFLIICAFTGLFALITMLREGRNVLSMRLSELTITGRSGRIPQKEVM